LQHRSRVLLAVCPLSINQTNSLDLVSQFDLFAPFTPASGIGFLRALGRMDMSNQGATATTAEEQKPKLSAKHKLGIVAIIIAVLIGFGFWTLENGRAAAYNLAVQNNLCANKECAKGVEEVLNFSAEAFGRGNVTLAKWCLGTDDWAAASVRRGEIVRDAIVWVMYLPCDFSRVNAKS
jgi:hypothetical protein